MVSASRRAGPEHFGHGTFAHASAAPSGDVPLGARSSPAASGNLTGS